MKNILTLLISLFAVFAMGAGKSGPIESYSATQVEIHPNGNERPGLHLLVSGDRIRLIMAESPMDTGSAILLFLKPVNRIVTLFPEKKCYIEEKWSDTRFREFLKVPPGNATIKDQGSEECQGYPCRKLLVTVPNPEDPAHPHQSTVWKSPRFTLPLKVITPDGFTFELRNIKPGAQSEKFFAVPDGFKRVKSLREASTR